MNTKLCIDPQNFYNLQTLTCEGPKVESFSTETSLSAPAKLSALPSYSSPPTPILRNLQDYRRTLSQQAFPLEPVKNFHEAHFNPLTLGFLMLLPWGCGEDPATDNGGTDSQNDPNPVATGGTSGMDVRSDPPGGTGGTAGGVSRGGTGGTIGPKDGGATDASDAAVILEGGAVGVLPGNPVLHDSVPCGSDATITDLDEGLGVCTHFSTGPSDPANHHLFGWDPSTPNRAFTLNQLGFAPDQVLESVSGEIFVTTHGDSTVSPAQLPGMAMVNASLSDPVQHKPFPNIVLSEPLLSSTGRPVSNIPPTFPKGLAEFENDVFIATSNLDLVNGDFLPGTLLIYHRDSGNWSHRLTSGFNPTSVAVRDGKLYVVHSGAVDYNGAVSSDSSLDIFNPLTLELIRNIPLGAVAAGIEGEIAFSPDGQSVVLATGNNSGNLLKVDLVSKTFTEIPVAGGDKVLLSGVTLHPSETMAYVNNFNDGTLYAVNLNRGEVEGSTVLDEDTSDFIGLSDNLWSGASLFTGQGATILSLSLGTL